MLIVLIACVGAAPVCLSWLWSRIIPWLRWPFRLNFVIKIGSPTALLKLLLDPEDDPRATLCRWGPGVLLCGAAHMPGVGWQRAWQQHRAAVPAARGSRGDGDGDSPAVLTAAVCNRVLPAPHPQLHRQGSSPAPCCALQRRCQRAVFLMKSCFTALSLERKEGLGSKRLTFIGAPVWLVLSL